MASLKRLAAYCFNLFIRMYLALATRGIRKELASRNAQRGSNSLRWFTPEEAAVAEALARVIVPSDDETPGLDEVCVLDPPAIVGLDRLVSASPQGQLPYSRGLLSFDLWARKEHGCSFVDLRKEDQIALFRAAEQIYQDWVTSSPRIRRALHKLRAISRARNGSLYASQLYPLIRGDCIRIFYTSRVCWTWLEYDGPPMEKGYQSLTTPREP